ncbi:hypothetical protein L915_00234 [Phytophthora nicotianae]|nr:hypothetical protein L915_00234 [Phytophthora nicotianae]ETO86111.1 hypothetical protein F444_00312 [Phytophthora nicotianae P1976]
MEHKGYNCYCKRKATKTNTTYAVCAGHRAGLETPPEVIDVRREKQAVLQRVCLSNLALPPCMVW